MLLFVLIGDFDLCWLKFSVRCLHHSSTNAVGVGKFAGLGLLNLVTDRHQMMCVKIALGIHMLTCAITDILLAWLDQCLLEVHFDT